MSLVILHSEPINQNIFFKIIRKENNVYYPFLVRHKSLDINVWNKADSCVLETMLYGSKYTSGYHSFFLKNDAFSWSGKKYTRRRTNLELWEVEIKDVLATGYSSSTIPINTKPIFKQLTVVSNKLKLRRKICCLL